MQRRDRGSRVEVKEYSSSSKIIIIVTIIFIIVVTQPIYESRMNWIIDPTPPASAVNTPPSEARLKLPGRSRRRRRRKKKATAAANGNSAPRRADVTAPAERTGNDNSTHWRATRPRSAAND